jgi:hypothetical protein
MDGAGEVPATSAEEPRRIVYEAKRFVAQELTGVGIVVPRPTRVTNDCVQEEHATIIALTDDTGVTWRINFFGLRTPRCKVRIVVIEVLDVA